MASFAIGYVYNTRSSGIFGTSNRVFLALAVAHRLLWGFALKFLRVFPATQKCCSCRLKMFSGIAKQLLLDQDRSLRVPYHGNGRTIRAYVHHVHSVILLISSRLCSRLVHKFTNHDGWKRWCILTSVWRTLTHWQMFCRIFTVGQESARQNPGSTWHKSYSPLAMSIALDAPVTQYVTCCVLILVAAVDAVPFM